jgi:hypothetical protein
MNFFTQLKLKKAISYKTFYINYKDKDSGELIIGAYPHEYSKDEYKYENYKDIPCRVPCTLYGVLLENKLMENPYYRLNEKNATVLCEKDCSFETVFYLCIVLTPARFISKTF